MSFKDSAKRPVTVLSRVTLTIDLYR